VLRHDYDGLADRLIRNVVVDELPRPQMAVQEMPKSTMDNAAETTS
jgi:hypothetical protein